MKKTILYLCAGVLVLGLTACGGDKPEDGVGEGSGSQGTEQTGDTGSFGEAGTENGSTGTESSEEEDSQEGSGGAGGQDTQGWSQEMTELRAAVVEAVGETEYWPDMPMDQEMLETFYGINADMYEDYMAESPMISANVDTLVIIKAKEGQTDAVYDVLNTYREGLVNDTMQYPQNLGKIQASQVEKIGDYVIFVQLGGFAVESEDEADVITLCQEANGKALDAIRGKIEQ